jgi:hypothetical protein
VINLLSISNSLHQGPSSQGYHGWCLKFIQQVAKDLLELSEQQLQVAIATGELTEVGDDNDTA